MSSKKDRVLNNKNKSGSRPFILGGVIVVLAGALAFVIFGIPSTDSAATAGAESAIVSNDEGISVPVSTFDDGTAKYFRQTVNGTDVDFFILKSSDGVIRAAFDACDVCFQAKKGYSQVDDTMVCNNCGQRFASTRINEEKGGCNPSPLERNINGDTVFIKFDDIAQGIKYF